MTRGLTIYEAALDDLPLVPGSSTDSHAHIRSWFRSLDHPHRHALYAVERSTAPDTALATGVHHTLVVVREFRWVPLCASSLALTVFTARPGYAAALLATLAHFAERAVDVYRPAYLLVARSLEQPGLALLLAGVQGGAALQAAHPSGFSLDDLLPDVATFLTDTPEVYAYRADPTIATVRPLVSPHAV